MLADSDPTETDPVRTATVRRHAVDRPARLLYPEERRQGRPRDPNDEAGEPVPGLHDGAHQDGLGILVSFRDTSRRHAPVPYRTRPDPHANCLFELPPFRRRFD